jgi:chemotaxis protein MotB
MFALGKAELQPYTKTIVREIGKMLNDVPNKISLSGHTDGKPFPAGDKGFSNWELSADRANASRRELVLGGMDTDKMLKVVGLSSAVLFDKNDALNPINRRISIVVMNEKAVKAVTMEESETVEVDMQDKSPNPELLKPAS